MRKFLIAAAAMSIAVPAAAQPPAADPRDEEMRRSLPQPKDLEAMGEMAMGAVDALMGVPIGPLREAIEGRRLSRREREETIGDHAGRDDPHFRERMRDRMAVAGVALGALAEQLAVMTPVLRRTLEDVERRMEDATRGLPTQDGDAPGDDL